MFTIKNRNPKNRRVEQSSRTYSTRDSRFWTIPDRSSSLPPVFNFSHQSGPQKPKLSPLSYVSIIPKSRFLSPKSKSFQICRNFWLRYAKFEQDLTFRRNAYYIFLVYEIRLSPFHINLLEIETLNFWG